MSIQTFKNRILTLTDKATGEEHGIKGISEFEMEEPLESRQDNTDIKLGEISGTIKFKTEINEFKEAKRLFNILKHTRKIRTKKKLFNRINSNIAGKLYLYGIMR